jgi:predicted PurR-regulated permease PerM
MTQSIGAAGLDIPDTEAVPPDTDTDPEAGGLEADPDAPDLLDRIPRLGIWAWSFVGVVITIVIIVFALAAVSEIVLPLTFAAVLAVVFKPLAGMLQRRGLKPSLAAGLVVLGLAALMAFVLVATVRGVTDQAGQLSDVANSAVSELDTQAGTTGVDPAAIDSARAAIEDAKPMITTGLLSGLVSGIGAVVAVAGGLILGALIMYYLLKDGTSLRKSLVHQADEKFRGELDDFIGESCRILRDYGKGRSVMSAIVAVVIGVAALLLGMPLVFTLIVVNFVGGYIPYVGAFLGGGLAVIVALGDGGFPQAAIMLVVVLVANLALENFVEPKVMGRTLDVHPLVVLVVTALGGIIGGIVGLILAVPAYVIAGNAIKHLRAQGLLEQAARKAQPTVQHLLDGSGSS